MWYFIILGIILLALNWILPAVTNTPWHYDTGFGIDLYTMACWLYRFGYWHYLANYSLGHRQEVR